MLLQATALQRRENQMVTQHTEKRETWSLGSRELLLIFLFWTLLAAVISTNRLLDPRGFGLRAVSPVAPVIFPFIEAWTWALVTPLVFWLSSRFSIEKSNWFWRIPLLLVSGLLIAIGVDLLLEMIRLELFPSPRRRFGTLTLFRGIGRYRFLNQFVIFIAVLTAGFARVYFLRAQWRQQEAAFHQAEAAQLQAQLAQARLDALRMQINPHFLFNTLHAISALVEKNPGGVRRMIARLSELLRHSIDRRGSDEVPLREELDLLRRYIEIMEIRFQGSLRVEMAIEPETLDAAVPNLILQPLIENALEHGVSRVSGEGVVVIAAGIEEGDLLVSISDNGPGVTSFEPDGRSGGLGLQNTRARLDQMYGDRAELSLRARPDGGAVAEIRIPFRRHDGSGGAGAAGAPQADGQGGQ
jgi:two-component system, LytTR family, sensor kinase